MNKKHLDELIDIVKKYHTSFDKSDIERLREIIVFDRISALDYKGNGRIIVKKQEDVEKILQYLKENESFEFDYV